jgi:arylsulfatase A-like enzyme
MDKRFARVHFFLGITLAGISGIASSLTAKGVQQAPNIVFLLSDDQRWDAVGYAGNPVIQTPHLDQLAENATVFNNAFITTSICMASRASILTGQYVRTHGVNDFFTVFTDEQMAETYPVLLRKAGYYTGFINKWGIGDSVENTNLAAGYFDFWAGVAHQSNFWHERDCNFVLHDGITDKTNNICDCPPDRHGRAGPEVRHGKHTLKDPIHLETEIIPMKVRQFLESRDTNKPFCLSISLKSPHNPYDYDPIFTDYYVDVPMPLRPNVSLEAALAKGHARNSLAANQYLNGVRQAEDVDGYLQNRIRDYYRLISGMDHAIGELLAALREAGVTDNTIIVFTSDNGYLLGEHGLGAKWLPYEESIRVPFLIYDPRSPVRQQSSEHILNIDVAPTLLELAGLDVPAGMEGKSLLPLLENPSPKQPFREEWFYEHLYDAGGRIEPTEAIIRRDFKYIHFANHSDAASEELFNLENDPYELINLAQCPEHKPILNEMRTSLLRWHERLNPSVASVDMDLIFEDDFNRPDTGPTRNGVDIGFEYAIPGSHLQLLNGAVTGGQTVARAAYLIYTGLPLHADAFRIAADVMTGELSGREVGVVFNYQDSDNYYFARIQDSNLQVRRRVAGRVSVMLNVDLGIQANSIYRLSVTSIASHRFDIRFHGGTIDFSRTVVDSQGHFKGGFGGIIISNHADPSVDNLKIQSLSE